MDDAAPVALAIVLDNSPTSAWRTNDDDRNARLKEIADQLIAAAPPTSRIAIVDRSSTPAAFSLDVASAVSQVQQMRPLETPQAILARLDAAARLLETSDLPTKHVVLVTDLSTSSYDSDASRAGKLEIPFGEDSGIGFSILDLGPFDGINRSVSLPFVSDSTPAAGAPVPIVATIALDPTDDATGDAIEQAVTVELQVFEQSASLPVIRDGKTVRPQSINVQRRSVTVSPNSPVEVQLEIPPLETGQHHAVISLVGEDALSLDDAAYFSVSVLPPIRLLLVGDQEVERLRMAQAIVSQKELDDPTAKFRIEMIGFDDLAAVQLLDFRGVILFDPPRDVLVRDELSEFVTRGGNVLMCLGSSAGDSPLESDSFPSLVRRWNVPAPGSFFQTVSSSHPLMKLFSKIRGGVPWSDYRIDQYWQIRKRPTDQTILAYAGTGHPALVETMPTNPGAGRWMILTTPIPDIDPAGGHWNELFGQQSWPAFILVLSLADRLGGVSEVDSQSLVGSPVSLSVPLSVGPESKDTVRLQLFPPGDTKPVPIEVASQTAGADEGDVSTDEPRATQASDVVIQDTRRSGTYWLRGGGSNVGFSANLPRAAAQLTRVDGDRLDALFGSETYEMIESAEQVSWQDGQGEVRIPLRSPLMLLALVVFLLEQILGNRFYRSGASADKSSPSTRAAA